MTDDKDDVNYHDGLLDWHQQICEVPISIGILSPELARLRSGRMFSNWSHLLHLVKSKLEAKRIRDNIRLLRHRRCGTLIELDDNHIGLVDSDDDNHVNQAQQELISELSIQMKAVERSQTASLSVRSEASAIRSQLVFVADEFVTNQAMHFGNRLRSLVMDLLAEIKMTNLTAKVRDTQRSIEGSTRMWSLQRGNFSQSKTSGQETEGSSLFGPRKNDVLSELIASLRCNNTGQSILSKNLCMTEYVAHDSTTNLSQAQNHIKVKNGFHSTNTNWRYLLGRHHVQKIEDFIKRLETDFVEMTRKKQSSEVEDYNALLWQLRLRNQVQMCMQRNQLLLKSRLQHKLQCDHNTLQTQRSQFSATVKDLEFSIDQDTNIFSKLIIANEAMSLSPEKLFENDLRKLSTRKGSLLIAVGKSLETFQTLHPAIFVQKLDLTSTISNIGLTYSSSGYCHTQSMAINQAKFNASMSYVADSSSQIYRVHLVLNRMLPLRRQSQCSMNSTCGQQSHSSIQQTSSSIRKKETSDLQQLISTWYHEPAQAVIQDTVYVQTLNFDGWCAKFVNAAHNTRK